MAAKAKIVVAAAAVPLAGAAELDSPAVTVEDPTSSKTFCSRPLCIYFITTHSQRLNKFDDAHLSVISLSRHSPENTGVSTIAVLVTLGGSLEK